MILIIIFLVTIAIAVANYFILGKDEFKALVGTLTFIFVLNFIFLYAKFGAPSNIITSLLTLFGFVLSGILFIIVLVRLLRKSPGKVLKARTRIILLANCLVLGIVMLLPSLGIEGRYKVYNKVYTQSTEALIRAFKDQDLGVTGGRYSLSFASDLKDLEERTSKETVDYLKTLQRRTGVSDVIIDIDEEAVYFQFGSFLQSVDGIVVFKDLKGVSPDPAFIDKYIQGPDFQKIKENVYYYDGGL